MLIIIVFPFIFNKFTQIIFLLVIIISNFSKPSKSTKKVKIDILVQLVMIAYYVFYLPYLVFYMFRFEEVKMMYLKSISLIVLVYLVTFLFGYIWKLVTNMSESKKKIKKGINYGKGIFFIILLFGIVRYFEDEEQKFTHLEFIYDYTYESIYQVQDNTVDGQVYDFSFDDTYVYYLLRDHANDTYQFRLYNHKTNTLEYSEIVFEDESPNFQTDYQYFVKFDNQVYIFLDDGIYLYKDGMMNRLSNIDGTNTEKFIMDDQLYIYSEELNTMYTLDQIDHFVTSKAFVSNNHLYYYKNTDTLYRYDLDEPIGSIEYSDIEGITDTYYLKEKADYILFRIYEMKQGDTTIKNLYQTEYYHNEHFFISIDNEYMASIYSGPLVYRDLDYTFSETFDRMYSYYPFMEKNRKGAQPLYFEINQYVKKESHFNIDLSPIKIDQTIYIAFGLTILFLSYFGIPYYTFTKEEDVETNEVEERFDNKFE
jgi:hypothetical protein